MFTITINEGTRKTIKRLIWIAGAVILAYDIGKCSGKIEKIKEINEEDLENGKSCYYGWIFK